MKEEISPKRMVVSSQAGPSSAVPLYQWKSCVSDEIELTTRVDKLSLWYWKKNQRKQKL